MKMEVENTGWKAQHGGGNGHLSTSPKAGGIFSFQFLFAWHKLPATDEGFIPPLPGLPSSCKQGGNFKGENRSLLFRRRAVMPVTVSCHPLGDPGQPKPHQRDFCFFTAQRWPLTACRDVSVSSGVPVPAASHAPFPSTQALAIALSGAAGCGEN